MKYSKRANDKLGGKVITVNRPVGMTCPPDCFFLGNGCYAEKTENRWKHTRGFAESNLVVKKQEIVDMLKEAIRTRQSIRIHERGDFYKNNKLDKRYINVWKLALAEFSWEEICDVWAYSHIYEKEVAQLADHGINIYASVHNKEDYKRAKKAGFKLFAWATDMVKFKFKSNKDKPRYIDTPSGRTLVCPEQRMGHDRVTCTTCKWCPKGKGDVAFMLH